MKRLLIILAVLLIGISSAPWADTFVAEVEGIKLNVLNINLKKQFSEPMGASSPNKVVNIADGVSAEDIGVIDVAEPDQFAYELSFDFENVEIPVKAWATDGAGTYYYTTAAGIAESGNSDSAAWTGYDYMDTPQLKPERTDGRVVVQSYFPEAKFIAADENFTVTSMVDLDYTALFWDGTSDRFGPFADSDRLADFPGGENAFGLIPPDIVLAFNAELSVERYAFALDPANLTDGDFNNDRIVSLFFTSSGDLYDGAGKGNTGYSSFAPISTFERVKGVARNGDGTYNLAFARNYSEEQGEYIFDVTTDGTFTRMNAGDPAESMTITTSLYGDQTVWYKRIN